MQETLASEASEAASWKPTPDELQRLSAEINQVLSDFVQNAIGDASDEGLRTRLLDMILAETVGLHW
jgi:hypothetical protein